MAEIPHELIRQVQIHTRAAAGMPDYDPSDPSLPALPPLSATIAAAADPSSPDHRCKNCKASLLRGSDSIVCLYCGIGPHFDAVPDPISFTSTVGYQCLLHSLRLDGSEMVDTNSKPGKNQSSPRDLMPLSVFLDFKIPWPAETVNKEISSNQYLEDSKKSSILPGVAPDRFFLKSEGKGLSDAVIEHPSDHKLAPAIGTKDVAALGDQDLFQNVQSSKPVVSSSEHKTSEALSGWEADFQFADTEDQLGGHTSSNHVTATSEGSDNISRDLESFQSSSGLNVDLSAHLDSVFGPGENLNDGRPKDGPSPLVAFGNWDSDDTWNNPASSAPNLSDGFDATLNDQTLRGPSNDLSSSVDLFQDFQSQTNYADTAKNVAVEEHTAMDEDIFDDWNDFASSTSLQNPSQNAWAVVNDQVSTTEVKPSESDFFSFDDKFEGDNKSSEITNKFEDDKKYSERDLYRFDNKFQDENKSSEVDLFSFENSFGGDFSGSSQSNLFSSSNNNAPADSNATTLADDASNWFNDMSNPSVESVQAANNSDAFGQSTEDDVKMLISQIHDLSFMLETDLSIPSGSDEHKSIQKD